jgi:type I restriction enzyme, S subunit
MVDRELPDGWKWTTLADASEIILGQSPSSDTYNTEGKGLPFYQGKAEFGDVYPTKAKWCSVPGKIAEAGDVLISVRAPVGPTNLCQEKSCIGRGLAALRVKNGMPIKYLLFYLRLIEKEWDSKATGTTFRAITGDVLRQQPIPVAPLPEQQRIVAKIEELFTQLDAGVAALKRAQAGLKRYRASVLKAAVEGKLVDQDLMDGSAEELLENILAERIQRQEKYNEPFLPDFNEIKYIPSLPHNWTWVTLDQLTWSVKDGPHYSPKYVEKGIPFITGGNVRPDGVDFKKAKQISPELHVELSRRVKPEKGDILYTKGGTTGIARVNTYDIDFNVWVHVAVLKISSFIDAFYLQHALNSEFCYNQAQKYTHGVGNQDLGLTRMIKIVIPLPPMAEQRKIVSEVERRLSVAQKNEAVVSAALARAARLRQAVLKSAFEGRLIA